MTSESKNERKYFDAALRLGLPGLVAAIAVGLFLATSVRFYSAGFPLDDAWIHQTYARNLALRGEWSFLPGVRSAGSTAPLWTFLLAAGYRWFARPYTWAFLLGFACLWVTALAGEGLFRAGEPSWRGRIPWVGLFLAGEWHLVWGAASGMETVLFAALILVVFWLLAKGSTAPWVLGALAGLAGWVRPDGITLIGPVLFVLVFSGESGRARWQRSFQALAAFAVIAASYLAFNYLAAGSWLPNTLHAKQAEYAIYRQFSLLQRFFSLAKLPLVGAGVLLLPGALYAAWGAWRARRWSLLALALWWLGYTLLYALRLPVTYQHGRYLMPAMPVYFVLGGLGTVRLLRQRMGSSERVGFVVRRVWLLALAGTWVGFLGLGALNYARDVAIIETEMVRIAIWVNQNTPPRALIAAHDIGAMGYFSERELVDLAGLVSPEVISFIRDEERLAQYLSERRVDYLVTFPGWYPELARRAEPVYRSRATFSPQAGGENMVVYRWQLNGRLK